MTKTLPAAVAAGALFDRYAAEPMKEYQQIVSVYDSVDQNIVKRSGKHPADAERAAELLHRVIPALKSLYERRVTASPHLAGAIKKYAGFRWDSLEKLLSMPNYIPPIDRNGRRYALEAAERIRLNGGLVNAAPGGEIDVQPGRSFTDLPGLDATELEQIKQAVMAETLDNTKDPLGATIDASAIASMHADEAMRTYGIDAAWVETKNAKAVRPEIIDLLKKHIATGIRNEQAYNAITKAHAHIAALSGGSDNAVAIWLNAINHISAGHSIFEIDSPAHLIAELRAMLDISNGAWKRLMRLSPDTLRQILAKQNRPAYLRLSSTATEQEIRQIYGPLVSAAERRAALGATRLRGPDQRLDSLFSTSRDAQLGQRDWKPMKHLIAEYIRISDMTTPRRGCTMKCVNATFRELLDHHIQRSAFSPVPKMRWHEYIASMRADKKRLLPVALDNDEPEPGRIRLLTEPFNAGEVRVRPLLSIEEVRELNYSLYRAGAGLWLPNTELFALSLPDRNTRGLIIMLDPHSNGRWRLHSFKHANTQGGKHRTMARAAPEIQRRLRNAARRRTSTEDTT